MSAEPPLPYARQTIDEEDVAAVVEALRGPWLTTGPTVEAFERAVCAVAGASHGVAVSSGTAALHVAMCALGVGPGDEVIVPTLTFVATANCVLYRGATPVLADVDPDTLLLDPAAVARLVTPRTRAVIGVDYGGQPCDWAALRAAVRGRDVTLVSDGCHALGAREGGVPVGRLADLTTFSFHPAKHVTTAEGGLVVTEDAALARRARLFRNHGITTDLRERERAGTWSYDMVELGFNYRLSDLQSALGLSQLRRLPAWLERRRALAAAYDAQLAGLPGVAPLARRAGVEHAWHLYVVRVDAARRDAVISHLRARGIGANVHYRPVHLQPYHQARPAACPVADREWRRLVTLPLFPAMTDADVARVVGALREAVA